MCWLLCVGYYVLVTMGWLLCVGYYVLVTMCWLLCVGYYALVTMCWLLCVSYYVLVTMCWLLCVMLVISVYNQRARISIGYEAVAVIMAGQVDRISRSRSGLGVLIRTGKSSQKTGTYKQRGE